MSNEPGKGGFSMPPRKSAAPDTDKVRDFVQGAVRPQVQEPTVAAVAPQASTATDEAYPWEQEDDGRRPSGKNMRFTDRELQSINFIYRKSDARSAHEWIIRAIHKELNREIERLTGTSNVFGEPQAR